MGQVASHISGYFNEHPDDEKKNLQSKDHYTVKSTTTTRFVRNEIKYRNEKYNDSITSSSFSLGILATPRNPLKRTRQISPPVSLPQSILDIFSPAKKPRTDEYHLGFHFLEDPEIIGYYRKSKILIILRGLPGSGKTTISKHIEKKYVSSKVCSADLFFMKDGEYVYDGSLIREAHAQCQRTAIKAVQEQTSVVVIDNTNLKLWELNFYLELAHEFNYVPVVVEPQTPWRRDIPTLVFKTVHNINEEIMEIKNKNFEELQPLYYGWFLNESDSLLLIEEGQSWIEEAYKLPEFRKDFQYHTETESLQELLNFFEKPGQGFILHCTAKYTGRGLTLENRKYISSEDVESSLGKVFDIEIVGFVLTPRTFGARIKLSSEQMTIWGKDDSEEIPFEFWNVGNERMTHEEKKDTKVIENGNDIVSDADQSLDSTDGLNENANLSNGDGKLINDCDVNSQGGASESLLDYSCDKRPRDTTLPVNNHNSKENAENGVSFNNSINSVTTDKDNSLSSEFDQTEDTTEEGQEALTNELRAFRHFENKQSTQTSQTKHSPKKDQKFSPKAKKSPKKQGGVTIPENTLHIEDSLTKATMAAHPLDISEDQKFTPTHGKGSRAHFTLGCAPEVKPVTTGLDLIFAIEKEGMAHTEKHNGSIEKRGQSSESPPSLNSNFGEINQITNGNLSPMSLPSHTIDGGFIHNHGNGVWVIYPEDKLVAKSIFSMAF